jgi:hypothetical protein
MEWQSPAAAANHRMASSQFAITELVILVSLQVPARTLQDTTPKGQLVIESVECRANVKLVQLLVAPGSGESKQSAFLLM